MRQDKYPDNHPWWPWLVAQKERHLMFMNWAVDPAVIRPLIPSVFTLDTFDGKAWVTLAPFHMDDLHIRFLPPIPGTSSFPELDFFTYVTVNGQPGQYFFSIYAKGSLFSMTANLVGLPYRKANIDFEQDQSAVHFIARGKTAPNKVLLDVEYMPKGRPFFAKQGTLEFFLAERYTMFSRVLNLISFRGDEARAPRELFEAEISLNANRVFDSVGLHLSTMPDTAFYTPVADDKTWAPYPIFVRSGS
jgi:uncharacterized protein YqjF (DUF2071 family)